MTRTASLMPLTRAEHVGSLLRPARLVEARKKIQGDWAVASSKPLWVDELAPMEDECIREAVAMQESLGFKVVTDGELRRRTWWQNFVSGIEGTVIQIDEHAARFSDGQKEYRMPTPKVQARLRRSNGIATHEFSFLKSIARAMPKITIPSPPIFHFFGGRVAISMSAYEDLDLFWDDIVSIYRAELGELRSLGCTYVQLDEVSLACLCDPKVREGFRARGEDPDRVMGDYVRVINEVLSAKPEGMHIGIHMCRGNSSGRWLAEGSYDYIAERIFNELKADVFLLEYDSPRAGDFSPLRFVPDTTMVCLGLVTSKAAQLESKDDLKRRIDEASKFVSQGQLGLCPQCGFGTNFLGAPLTHDEQQRKLALVVETASEIWGSS